MSQKARHSTCENRLSNKGSPKKKHSCRDASSTGAVPKTESKSQQSLAGADESRSGKRKIQKPGHLKQSPQNFECKKGKQALSKGSKPSGKELQDKTNKPDTGQGVGEAAGKKSGAPFAKMASSDSEVGGASQLSSRQSSTDPTDSTDNNSSPETGGEDSASGVEYQVFRSNIDSSDIEVLPDKDSSDSIEILDSDTGNANLSAKDLSESASICSVQTITDQIAETGTTPTKEVQESTADQASSPKSTNISSKIADAENETLKYYPVDAVVNVDSKDKSKKTTAKKTETVADLICFVSPTGGRDPMGFAASSLPPQLEHGGFSHYDYSPDLVANGGVVSRPDSLSLPKPLQHYERNKFLKQSSESSGSEALLSCSSTEELIHTVSSTPLQAQGTVTKEGDLMNFVADDLAEKIKRSSPLTKKGNLALDKVSNLQSSII